MSSNNVITISPIGGGGGGNSAGSGVITTSGNWSNNAISSITLTGSGGGYRYASSGVAYSATSSITPVMTVSNTAIGVDESDVTIRMKSGKEIRVGKSISMLLEHLMLIVPDDREIESNPALKLAYENYLEVYKRRMDPELAEAYETYQTVRKLTRDE
jgi:hypothetical protein